MGNFDVIRDWGYVKDYVRVMWMILNYLELDDFVIVIGEGYSVREFVEKVFKVVDIEIEWLGRGVDEKGIDVKIGRVFVEIDLRYFRLMEVDILIGDFIKVRKIFGWELIVIFE